jgi:hypothetical protein
MEEDGARQPARERPNFKSRTQRSDDPGNKDSDIKGVKHD